MKNDPMPSHSIPGAAASETEGARDEAQAPKQKLRLLKGCALGCGGLIVLMLLLTALGILLRGHIAGFLRASFAGQYTSNCYKARENGKLAEANDEVFSDVMVSIQRPETGLMAAVYACVLLERRLAATDTASREKAVSAATDLRELLYNEPAAGFKMITGIIQKYPELSAGSWYSKIAPPPPAPQH